MRKLVLIGVGAFLVSAAVGLSAKQPEYHGGWKMTWNKEGCTIEKQVPQGTVSTIMDEEDETVISFSKVGWSPPPAGSTVKLHMSDFENIFEEVKVIRSAGNTLTIPLPITSWQGMMSSDTASVLFADGSRHDFTIAKPEVAVRAQADCVFWEVKGGPGR